MESRRSIAMKKRWKDPKWHLKMSIRMKGNTQGFQKGVAVGPLKKGDKMPEWWRQKMRDAIKRGGYGFQKGYTPWNKDKENSGYWLGKNLSEEHKAKISENNHWRGKPSIAKRPDVAKKISITLKERFKDHKNHPCYGKHWKLKKETIDNIRKTTKRLWQNPDFVKKQMKARNVTPNKTELWLERFINKILPNEYKFVGDGEFILGGKCPDFLNINGKKKLIELYGDYWHKGQEPQDRIDYFKKYGFNTLIIWESELKDILKLKQTILGF